MAKKAARKKRAAAGASHDLRLSFSVKPEQLAAIQRCLQKGKLTITVSSKTLGSGRALDGYLYD
jgi:hypothetical protein